MIETPKFWKLLGALVEYLHPCEFILMGSAPLAVFGVRDVEDLDVLVAPDALLRLEEQGVLSTQVPLMTLVTSPKKTADSAQPSGATPKIANGGNPKIDFSHVDEKCEMVSSEKTLLLSTHAGKIEVGSTVPVMPTLTWEFLAATSHTFEATLPNGRCFCRTISLPVLAMVKMHVRRPKDLADLDLVLRWIRREV